MIGRVLGFAGVLIAVFASQTACAQDLSLADRAWIDKCISDRAAEKLDPIKLRELRLHAADRRGERAVYRDGVGALLPTCACDVQGRGRDAALASAQEWSQGDAKTFLWLMWRS